jgi:hypothetical protein
MLFIGLAFLFFVGFVLLFRHFNGKLGWREYWFAGVVGLFLSFAVVGLISEVLPKENITEKMEVYLLKTSEGTEYVFKDGDTLRYVSHVKFDQTFIVGDQTFVAKKTESLPRQFFPWLLPLSKTSYILMVSEKKE